MANRAAHLFRRAEEMADKPAIIFGQESLTFGELASRVRAMAAALANLGIGKGARVGIYLPSSPDIVVVQQALFVLGATVTPLNVMYRTGEIAHAIACCELHFILTDDALGAPIACEAERLDCRAFSIDDEVLQALNKLNAPGQPAEVSPADPAMLLLTSATTGKAKGVILSAANLAANYDATPNWLGLSSEDTILCALPLYNTFGLNQGINAMLVTGATMILLPRFDVEQVIAAISHHACTFLPAVPTMLQRIFDHPEASDGSLRSLRRIMTGGAPVPGALLARILEKAPEVEVLTGYGLTEATALVTLAKVELGQDGELLHGRTIGRVLDGMRLAIRDDRGQDCAAGYSGEIVVQGPNVMQGYHKAPDDTASVLRDGWLHTGDIGYLDADGYAFIVDRKKDVIIRGGQNIYPIEIEDVLYRCSNVAEAAVIAGDDEDLGEVPVAFVAPTAGCRIDTNELAECCRAELAHYKRPAAIHVLDELPKGPTGKILRRALREMAL
ncbi:class I adenylate-forming enzyme family protein [Erythrobacter sp. EC-HK427]|uniref:class I adenylate-forming enzyme family protein n=1 Tax=Erythrobacter sp. EC-HK427 TaxID=2038396 RepID=UPI00125554CE|nr:AMP-binding protein [Erythrobacter sp. EC-HK427]VVT10355.1 Long-chain fatty acid--CoA ligase [Erythrobacter sp. EC-HK427]